MQTVIKRSQLSLWNEMPVVRDNIANGLSFLETKNDEGEVTAHSLRLLPTNAGKGKNSLAKVTSLTGEALRERHASDSRQLKDWLVDVAIKINRSPDIGGVGLKTTKSGRMTLVFKRLKPQVEMLTDEQMAEQLKCSVEEVAALRKSGQPADEQEQTEETTEQPELVPAPQNGKPILKPAKPAKPVGKK